MDTQAKKREVLGALLAWAFVLGAAGYFVVARANEDIQRAFNIGASVLSTVIMMRWFVLDAREHSFRFSPPLFLMMVALSIFVAPFYFVRTRGKKAWRPIAQSLLFLLLMGCALVLGEQAAYQGAMAVYDPRSGLPKPPVPPSSS